MSQHLQRLLAVVWPAVAAASPARRALPVLPPPSQTICSAGWKSWLRARVLHGPLWRRGLWFISGTFGGAVTVGLGSVALCRPFDTPPYLIPYYLRDVRSRFEHYASVKKRKGGPSYMTINDFVLALLASPEMELKDPAIADDLRELFDTFDANSDGYISFPEFRFLLALITSRASDVQTLFRTVDEDRQGAITVDQFADVLRGLTRDEAVVHSLLRRRRSGILAKLFGDEAHPRRCTCEELAALVDAIREEVWKAEFRLYDPERTGHITAEQFSELLASQVLGVHLPYYIVENMRRLRRGTAGGGGGSVRSVSLSDWVGFHRLLQKGEVLAEAVELYCASGLPLTRQSFERVLAATGLPLPPVTVDIVFAVFDKDGNGTVEFDEFMYLMRQKISHHYQVTPRERRSLPTRLWECSSAAVAEALHG